MVTSHACLGKDIPGSLNRNYFRTLLRSPDTIKDRTLFYDHKVFIKAEGVTAFFFGDIFALF